MATIRERLNDVVQQVTTSLRNGVLPWRVMKDRTETYVVCNPANVVTLNPYQGRNYWLANIACGLNKWDSAWFATYLQWKENGCKVKAGEKSVLISKYYEEQTGFDPNGNPIYDHGWRWYHVFNISQVEAYNPKGEMFLNVSRTAVTNHITVEKVYSENLDENDNPYYNIQILDTLPNKIGFDLCVGPTLTTARLDLEQHCIVMPPKNAFSTTESYYMSLLVQVVLASANACGRLKDRTAGVQLNARERLVAEMSAIYLADAFGIISPLQAVESGVITQWISSIESNERYLFDVIGDAVKTSRYIMEKLGINIIENKKNLEKKIKEENFIFLFAPHYHLAMKNVASVRKNLPFKTIFNLLGPLINPGFVKKQMHELS